jgi:uncharacterized membrane protein YraQ (UPF0718 family)
MPDSPNPSAQRSRKPEIKTKRMDPSFWILLALTVAAALFALAKGRDVPVQGLSATFALLGKVWPELLLGFVLAGLLDVLIPAPALAAWLGGEHLARGIALGWAAGLLIPGGPYVVFPMVAGLLQKGAAAGPLIALVTAKTLVSPIRMLTYEAPMLGWPLTLARLVPGLLVPPLLALAGHWLFTFFERR